MQNLLKKTRWMASLLWLAGATQFSGSPSAIGQEAVGESRPSVELNHANYQTWREHILPHEAELKWQQIPWLTTFKDGILAANQAEKPLLFWTMNGHPLGCT